MFERFPKKNEGDVSFASFLRRPTVRRISKERRDTAKLLVEGLNAAHADRISVKSLAGAESEEERVDTTRLFHVAEGYDVVPRELLRGASTQHLRIELNTVVTAVRRNLRGVEFSVVAKRKSRSLRAAHAVITLPLGVLQARPPARGAVRFDPPIPDKIKAAKRLVAGPIVKIAILFDRPFWEKARLPKVAGRFADMTFMHRLDAPVRTWWNYRPLRTGVLMGWAGGPAAVAQTGRRSSDVLRDALRSLSMMLGVPTSKLRSMVKAYRVADWQVDPFARGAYSYVAVGGADAMRELARPVGKTLFFAGEATQHETLSATVQGAIQSGWRAADEVIAASRRAQTGREKADG